MPFPTTLQSLFFSFVLVTANVPALYAQGGITSAASGGQSPFRVTRSIAGAAGHENNNKFVMDDARSVFDTNNDSKVFVYFEWDGPLGPHHFEGLWIGPEGKIVLISDFRYEAKTTHFSGYWTMLLSPGTPLGEWSLQARIDGEPAGSLSFVITGHPVANAAPPPQTLTAAALYRTAIAATVVIEKLAQDGTAGPKSTGFWIGDGQILTSFESIDGASSVRISAPGLPQATTDQVIAWNRWQDWAVLKVDAKAPSILVPSKNATANVGDHCVFLEWGTLGTRLADGTISGVNTFSRAGPRLLVSSGVSSESVGGALLDDFGHYVGIISGSIVPAANPMRILSLLSDPGASVNVLDPESTGLAVPLSLLLAVPQNIAHTSFAGLASRGEFAPLVVKSAFVQNMTVARPVGKYVSDAAVTAIAKQIFSKRDRSLAIYVSWRSSQKEKFVCQVQVFSVDNKLITVSKPQKISLDREKYSATSWDVALDPIAPGIYRADLLVNDQTVWREFFRVTE